MRRRSVLAGVLGLAAGSGCTRAVSDDPVDVRVMRVGDADVESADDQCRLSESFLEDHHVLERTLESAETAPAGEWVTDDTDRNTGRAIADALREHCEADADIYRYDGDPYRIRVVEAESGDPLLEGATGIGRDGSVEVGPARAAEFGSD